MDISTSGEREVDGTRGKTDSASISKPRPFRRENGVLEGDDCLA